MPTAHRTIVLPTRVLALQELREENACGTEQENRAARNCAVVVDSKRRELR